MNESRGQREPDRNASEVDLSCPAVEGADGEAPAVREANAGDAAAIARLHVESWRVTYRGTLRDGYLDGNAAAEPLARWEGSLPARTPDCRVLVACEGKALQGVVAATRDADPRWGTLVENLHVHPRARGRGIGTRLLGEVARWAAGSAASRGMFLWVLEGNVIAERFYEGLGAHAVEVTAHHAPGGGFARGSDTPGHPYESLATRFGREEGRKRAMILAVSGRGREAAEMGEGWGDDLGIGFYAETYDAAVPDWPGEIRFYLEAAQWAAARGEGVLELACGTGRVALRLAQAGADVVGLDVSSDMLALAGLKSLGVENVQWVEGDMRSFDLERTFGLVLVPGHAFHNLLTPADQVACLSCAWKHLSSGGMLVLHLDHQDIAWLGDLARAKGGIFEEEETFERPKTGRKVRAFRAWTYERSTQTATCQTRWEELDDGADVVETRETEPIRLHCLFRFEVEHLLARTGFEVRATYGDFFGQPLADDSPEMIWVARKPEAGEQEP